MIFFLGFFGELNETYKIIVAVFSTNNTYSTMKFGENYENKNFRMNFILELR